MIAYPPGPPDEFGPKRLLRMSRDPLGFFTQLRRDHGRFVHYRIGPRRVFFLADPELIQDVLVKQARSFLKDQGLESTKPLLGEGLLTSEGEFHRRQRRLVVERDERGEVLARVADHHGQRRPAPRRKSPPEGDRARLPHRSLEERVDGRGSLHRRTAFAESKYEYFLLPDDSDFVRSWKV